MGSVSSCCMINSSSRSLFSNTKTQTEISVDAQNSNVHNTGLSRSKVQIRLPETTDHSSTSVTSTNLIPKRNKSSIVVKPVKYKMNVNKDNIKRANSVLEEVSDYILLLEERLCGFSKNRLPPKLKYEEDDSSEYNTKNSNQASVVPSETVSVTKDRSEQPDEEIEKVITLKKCHDEAPSCKRSKKKQYDVINEPLSEKQLYYIKKILFDEEILIEEMDEATM